MIEQEEISQGSSQMHIDTRRPFEAIHSRNSSLASWPVEVVLNLFDPTMNLWFSFSAIASQVAASFGAAAATATHARHAAAFIIVVFFIVFLILGDACLVTFGGSLLHERPSGPKKCKVNHAESRRITTAAVSKRMTDS